MTGIAISKDYDQRLFSNVFWTMTDIALYMQYCIFVYPCEFDKIVCSSIFCCFVFLVNISNMEEHQVILNAIQNIEEFGTPSTLVEIHDDMKKIEQMFLPFKHYIEVSRIGMVPKIDNHGI